MTKHNLNEHLEWLRRTRPQVPQKTQRIDTLLPQIKLGPILRSRFGGETAAPLHNTGERLQGIGPSKSNILPSNTYLSSQLSDTTLKRASDQNDQSGGLGYERESAGMPTIRLDAFSKRPTLASARSKENFPVDNPRIIRQPSEAGDQARSFLSNGMALPPLLQLDSILTFHRLSSHQVHDCSKRYFNRNNRLNCRR